jgi:hypothetical protein
MKNDAGTIGWSLDFQLKQAEGTGGAKGAA